MNIVCIIQARTGSTRLPNKIFLDLAGKPSLFRVIERVKKSNHISQVAILTPTGPADDIVVEFVRDNFPEIKAFRDSSRDVLSGYYLAANDLHADAVVRITGDCPLIDPGVIDRVIKKYLEDNVDYVSNVFQRRTYPRGLDVEIISFAALKKIHLAASEPEDREHVTLYLRKRPQEFSTLNIENEIDYSNVRLTLDEPNDYKLIKIIYDALCRPDNNFRLTDIIDLLNKNPEYLAINRGVKQKHGKY